MPQHRETPNFHENFLVLDSTLADFLAGKQVCDTKEISNSQKGTTMSKFAISSFILYWQLKISSSARLLWENNFSSSNRAAILSFSPKNSSTHAVLFDCTQCFEIIRLLLLVFLFVPSLHQMNNLRDALFNWTGNASSSIKTANYIKLNY